MESFNSSAKVKRTWVKLQKKCNFYQYLILEKVLFSIQFYVSKEEVFALNAKDIDNNT